MPPRVLQCAIREDNIVSRTLLQYSGCLVVNHRFSDNNVDVQKVLVAPR
jgi:hypothetical protein